MRKLTLEKERRSNVTVNTAVTVRNYEARVHMR